MKHYMIALWRLGYVKWLTLYTSAGAAIVSQWVLLYAQVRPDVSAPTAVMVTSLVTALLLIGEVIVVAMLIDVGAKIYSGFIESHVLEIQREAQELRRIEEQRGEITTWNDEG